ncbi:hypothetical protein ACHWQZ_G007528 [Mnemiopsis leidyi]
MRRDRRHIINEYLFCKDKKKNGNNYYRCTFFSAGCKAMITLNENNDLVSPTPDHNHETQVAETHVHVVKQDLKRKVPTSDLPAKNLVAEDCRPLFDRTK